MDTGDDAARRARARAARFATLPLVLAGTIAVTAGLTGPIAHADQRHRTDDGDHRHESDDRNLGDGPVFTPAVARNTSHVVAATVAAVQPAPASYTVSQGDTVSAIAARYGLSSRDVLTANGLSWNAIIYPGQTLRLSGAIGTEAAVSTSSTSSYHVVSGDTASAIAARLGVSTTALLTANQLSSTSVIYPGQTLRVPAAGAASTTTTAVAPVSSAQTPSSAGTRTIAPGDSIASIAAANRVSVAALLAANGLTYTSTIYAGTSLVIPNSSGTVITSEMRANAAAIVSVGRSLGVPDRGLVIALATAMQESDLRNLPFGDRDSVGVFQQRSSQGWGSPTELTNPTYAARLFFGGPQNPNAGRTRGLLDVPGWESMSIAAAAQTVQYSAYPDAYAQWEQPATALLASL